MGAGCSNSASVHASRPNKKQEEESLILPINNQKEIPTAPVTLSEAETPKQDASETKSIEK